MAIMVVVACLFATLVGRLWYLQGIEAKTATAVAAQQQGIETVYIPAPRGDIFDRNGVLLAGNHIEQVVTVQRDELVSNPQVVGVLSALLHQPAAQINQAINNSQYSPVQPVPVAEGVSNSVALAVEENQGLLPGVTVQAEPVRYYPDGTAMANVLGYVSQITGTEYGQDQTQACAKGIPCYANNSVVGQAGVESAFEKYLRGTPGVEKIEVDSQGQQLGMVPGSYRPPVPGDDLVLTLSLNDQQTAVNALATWIHNARRGPPDIASGHPYRAPAASMVVEDPRNGQILALATNPDYNPSDFLGGISVARWKYYMDPVNNYPLEDRAISDTYSPGSTWKLVTSTAMLDYGVRSPYTYYNDVGYYKVGNTIYHDNDNVQGGYVDLQSALTISSDAYFYSLGYQFWQTWFNNGTAPHPEDLQHIASEYGLGHYSGVNLPGEAAGIVPTAEVFQREHQQFPKVYASYFYPGDEVEEAIGQGQDEVTPLQLDNTYSAFANGGTLYVPQVALAIEAPGQLGKPSGRVLVRFGPKVKDHVQMPSAAGRQAILAGLEGVTSITSGNDQGTAAAVFTKFPLSQYPVAGKTGTAQVGADFAAVGWPKYQQDTSVFASFAPAESPRYAVSAVFEQAGYGASTAAPAVEQEYETLFGLNKPAPKAARAASGAATSTTAVGTTGTGG